MKQPTFRSCASSFLITICIVFSAHRSCCQPLIDLLYFGNTTSERTHSLQANLSEVYAGSMGEQARQFLPKYPVDYYGGDATFRIKVDPVNQNYFTVKLAGDENRTNSSGGRLLLTCEGKEVGSRHGKDEDVFVIENGGHVCPGAFWYRTVPLPLLLTTGKTAISIGIRSIGSFFPYGKVHDYDTYQRKLQFPTVGIYACYTHTNPYFTVPAGERQGVFPAYANAPLRSGPGVETIQQLEQRCNDQLNKLLKGSDYIQPYNNNNYNEIEYLAFSYQIPWTIGYKNPAILDKVLKAIDENCRKYILDSTKLNAWGGAFGRLGYAIHLLYPQLKSRLDDQIDLGKGPLTRRINWATMLKASFDEGRWHRRTITNQELECVMSIYGANLGLLDLDPAQAVSIPEAKRYIYEGIGLQEWRGDDLPGGGSKYNFGRGYFMMTTKGTSHEPGWVSQDCYGNLGGKLFEIYKMCGNDTAILHRAIQLEKIQSYFRYAAVDADSGYRAMVTEGVICSRNEYHPGKVYYGNIWLAGEVKDPAMLGYIQQMISDGQFFFGLTGIESVVYSDLLFLPQAYEKYKVNIGNVKGAVNCPSTPGMPDYAVADEENGIVAVKHSGENFFIMLYRRADAINFLAKAHHITPQNEREIEFIEDDVRFTPSGKFNTVGGQVEEGAEGTPPDNPENAWKGNQEPIPLAADGTLSNPNRRIAEFYAVRYGNYLIAMNTTRDKTFQWLSPVAKNKAIDLVSGKAFTLSNAIAVGPSTTLVFYLN